MAITPLKFLCFDILAAKNFPTVSFLYSVINNRRSFLQKKSKSRDLSDKQSASILNVRWPRKCQ